MAFFVRRPAALAAAVMAAGVGGCVIGPYTGQTIPQETQGLVMTWSGYVDNATPGILGFVMKNPDLDPLVATNYQQVSPGLVQASSGPAYDGYDPTPLYSWGFTANVAMDQTKFPRGGLGRFRATGKFNGSTTATELYTMDNESNACISAEWGTKAWRQIGVDCRTPYMNSKYITTVSTVTTPDNERGAELEYLSYGGGHAGEGARDPNALALATDNYYASFHAPGFLDGPDRGPAPEQKSFKTRYGYPGTGEVHALYYNQADLGIARDMHCWATAAGLVACYVTNYGRSVNIVTNTNPEFGTLPPQTAINQALSPSSASNSPNRPVATVAMVYDPSVVDTTARTQFVVYNEIGDIDRYAALDTWGVLSIGAAESNLHPTTNANINVPDNCLTCHGASAGYDHLTSGTSLVRKAAFLPFDSQSFVYDQTVNSNYDKPKTLAQLKKLNSLVMKTTSPTSQIALLLKGMYPDPAPNNPNPGPDNPNSTLNESYIPTSWSGNKAATELYNEVVKPYCRTCHLTTAAAIDWDSYNEFTLNDYVWDSVCAPGNIYPMPQAEQVQNRFWKSPARGHLAGALGASGACRP
ncbi:MAG: hypothetical protein U0441_10360 [Polyangiaceae bacterium]